MKIIIEKKVNKTNKKDAAKAEQAEFERRLAVGRSAEYNAKQEIVQTAWGKGTGGGFHENKKTYTRANNKLIKGKDY